MTAAFLAAAADCSRGSGAPGAMPSSFGVQSINRLEEQLSKWHDDCEALDPHEAEGLAHDLLAWRGEGTDDEVLHTALQFLEAYVRDTGDHADAFKNFLLRVVQTSRPTLVASRARGYLLILYGDSTQFEPLAQLLITADCSEAIAAVVALKEAAAANVNGSRETIQRLLQDASLNEDVRDMLCHE